jgi:catechol 2,3-dioxygenase-like lactoylglutathione lyase family enzyme
MAVQLNHTIVHARSSEESARFLAEILGLAPPGRFGPFVTVATENGVTLDFIDDDRGPIEPGHYAFLLSEPEFDTVFGRIRARGLAYWADPHRRESGAINHHDGGRGVYFQDPSGHLLEIITRPYGSGSA